MLLLTLNHHADKINLLSSQIENVDSKLESLINVLPVKLMKVEWDIDCKRWHYTYEYVSPEESNDTSDILKINDNAANFIYTTPEFQTYLESLEMISKDTLISYIGLSGYDDITKMGMIKLPITLWDDIMKGYEEYVSECNQ